jgi:hypothetical protein
MECGIALPEYLHYYAKNTKKYCRTHVERQNYLVVWRVWQTIIPHKEITAKKSPTFFISILRIILFTVK